MDVIPHTNKQIIIGPSQLQLFFKCEQLVTYTGKKTTSSLIQFDTFDKDPLILTLGVANHLNKETSDFV